MMRFALLVLAGLFGLTALAADKPAANPYL